MLSGVSNFGLEDSESNRAFYHPDTHLTSPLQIEKVTAAHEEARKKWPREYLALSSTKPVCEFHSLFSAWLLHGVESGSHDKRHFYWDQVAQDVAAGALETLSEFLGVKTLAAGLRTYTVTGIHVFYLEASRWLEGLVKEAGYKITERSGSVIVQTYKDLTVRILNSAAKIEFNGWSAALDYSCLLMMSDVVQQRCITLLSTQLSVDLIDDGAVPVIKDLVDLYRWGDEVLRIMGNQGYSTIKSLEPLTLGQVLQLNPGVEYGRPMSFCTAMVDELYENVTAENHKLADRLLSILRRDSMTPKRLLQIFGLFRHWGHPFVEVVPSIKKNRSIAEPEKVVSKKDQDMLKVAMIKLLNEAFKFSLSYEEGKLWVKSCDDSLKEHIRKTGRLAADCAESTVATIEFGKSIHWEGEMNILDIFSDKACGLSRTELTTCLAKRTKGSWEKRRTLVRMFSEETLDLDAIVKDLDEFGISEEDATIGVTPKERELKIKPRLFSLLSMRLKYYFGLSEMLLAKNVLPRVNEITMTDDSIQLFKKQSEATMHMRDGSDVVAIVINIDFEKWNLNMRESQTKPGFSVLDQIFGFDRLFSMTHQVFKKCLFYCFDGFHYATVEGNNIVLGDLAWTNQEGGCEGLRQKGWTLVTVSVLKSVLSKYDISFRLMGQGDNEVPVLFFPIRERGPDGKPTEVEAARIRASFSIIFDDLVATCTRIGLPIKKDETWSSSYLFTYGKFPILQGVPQSVNLKRLARCFPLANEDYPSLFVALSSISANAQSACLNSETFLLSYIVQMMCCGTTIRSFLAYHPLCGKPLPKDILNRMLKRGEVLNIDLSNHDLIERALLLGDASMGGLPISNPLSFLCRGFPDAVSLYLTWAALYKEFGPPGLNKVLVQNYAAPIFSREISYDRLLENPTSLNILSPNVKENLLKNVATRLFLETPLLKNKELKSIVTYYADEHDTYADVLCSRDSLAPRVLSDLISQSPLAAAFGIIGKLTSTKTIRHLMKGESNLRSKLIMSECSCLAIPIIQAFRQEKLSTKLELTTVGVLCDELRSRSWKKQLVGVTVEHPFSFLRRISRTSAEGPCLECSMNPVFVEHATSHRYSETIEVLGPYKPYFGSSAMFSFPQLHDHVSEIPSSKRSKIKRLLALRSVFAHDPSIKGTSDAILESLTGEDWKNTPTFVADLSLSSYYGLEKPGGGVLNNLYGPLTHLSSRLCHFHIKGVSSLNRSILFQTIITVTQATEVLLRKHAKEIFCGHWHYRETEWREINHQDVSKDDVPEFKTAKDLALVWVGPIQARLNVPKHQNAVAATNTNLGSREVCEILGEVLSEIIAGGTAFPVGSMDVKMSDDELFRALRFCMWHLKKQAVASGVSVQSSSDYVRVQLFDLMNTDRLISAYEFLEGCAASSEDFFAALYCEENEGITWEQQDDLIRNRLITLASMEPNYKYTIVKENKIESRAAAWILQGYISKLVTEDEIDVAWPVPAVISLDHISYATKELFEKVQLEAVNGVSSIRWRRCDRTVPSGVLLTPDSDEVVTSLLPDFLCRKRPQFYVWADVLSTIRQGARALVVVNDQSGDVTSAALRVGVQGALHRLVVRELGFFWKGSGIIPWDRYLSWTEGLDYQTAECSIDMLKQYAKRSTIGLFDLTHLPTSSKIADALGAVLYRIDCVSVFIHVPRFRSRTTEYLLSIVGSFYQDVDVGISGFCSDRSMVIYASIRFLTGTLLRDNSWRPTNRVYGQAPPPIPGAAENIAAQLDEPIEDVVDDHRRKLIALCPFVKSQSPGTTEDHVLDWLLEIRSDPSGGLVLDGAIREYHRRAMFFLMCLQISGFANNEAGDYIGLSVINGEIVLKKNSNDSIVKIRTESAMLRSAWWRNVISYLSSITLYNKVFRARMRGLLRSIIRF